ncbi:MAG: PEGA domain-containing protein [Candidatus Contendobacter sp.]|nr:PEGA domain-containing protein [Candidatus Contendobacter sp.]
MGKILLMKVWGLLLGLVIAFWLPAGPARAAGTVPEARMTAAVVEFQVRGGLDEQSGAIIADQMMAAIANTGRFVLRDRLPLSAAAKIAKASELGETGLLDPKTAAELGRLYGLDAVVTGGVYKLGDLITVTARLIDTRNASLLRSGQIQGKDIDTIQIKINELATMVTAPPDAPKLYALTVKTDPTDANVRLLNSPKPYQPGIQLAAGEYEIEVTRSGYVTRKEKLRIADRALTANVALEKAKYGLTIRPEPADAQVRLLNSPTAYQPGVALVPGDYEVEVTREGYVARKFPVRIVDGDVAVQVALQKTPLPPPPSQYRLTVLPDPPQAMVRLLNSRTPYQAGVRLPPGEYQIEVTLDGYEPSQIPVRIAGSDVTLPVGLKKIERPTAYRLTVQPDPATAQVRLVDSSAVYQPGVQLTPGRYTVEVTQAGYEPAWVTVQIVDSDVMTPVKLTRKAEEPPKPSSYRLTVHADPADARIRLLNAKTAYQPGVVLAPGNYTVEVSRQGYETKQIPIRIADSDVTVPVTLTKEAPPEQYRLTVRADPADARIRLLNAKTAYQPGVVLAPGNYTVEVSRQGYETKQIPIRIADSDVTVPVTLTKEAPPEQYRLTVQTDPPGARVRLRGIKTAYRPGVTLPPGSYTVEVSQAGYETKQVPARIMDSDATISVTLTKLAEPTQYRLTVQTDPPGAQVRLRGAKTDYRPGVSLPPGGYTVEVSQAGYETKQVAVRIVDGDVALPVTLTRQVEPTQYRLTVQTDPPGAQVRLRGTKTGYRPGVTLPPGSYTVEVSQSGYETKQVAVRLVDGDVTLPVTLAKEALPEQYRLTVRANPTDAKVRLVNSSFTYRPGVSLPPGNYVVEVTGRGYETKRESVRIVDGDVTLPVELERSASTSATAPAAPSAPTRPGEWRISAVQADGSLDGPDRAEFMRIFGGYVGRTVTRDTLLDGALRFYQSTGVTLGFAVRTGGSGTAELSGRVVKRVRRGYETNIPILTRGQLESAGFGVSVQ